MVASSKVTNTAAVLHGAGDLRIQQRTPQAPPPGHAQVKIMSTTLCGSDCMYLNLPYKSDRVLVPSGAWHLRLTPTTPVHYFAHGRNGTFQLQHPMCLGHESSGIVIAVGPGVTSIRPGMRVAVECGIPCKDTTTCTRCREGRYNLCPELRFCSSAKTHPHLDGTLQTLMNHPADLLHPLPSNLSYDQGALAEPLGVVIHAARRAALGGEGHGVRPGADVLVFGAGAVGLLACMLARAHGARNVVCVDVNEDRLQFAKAQGFVGVVFNSAKNGPARQAHQPPAEALAATMDRIKSGAERIVAAAGLKAGEGFDVVFECTGAEPCIQTAVYVSARDLPFDGPILISQSQATRLGGKVMLVGMGTPNVMLPLSAAACREVDLVGVFRYVIYSHPPPPPALIVHDLKLTTSPPLKIRQHISGGVGPSFLWCSRGRRKNDHPPLPLDRIQTGV
jgi:L-iditol 2-dehydrogenase